MIRLRPLILAAAFFMDVHVKAEIRPAEPAACWGKTIPCAVFSGTEKKVLDAKGIRLVLGPGALIEQRSDDAVQLVAGSLYVETVKPLKISTPYGRFWCNGECKGLFHRREKVIQLKSLEGLWSVVRQGEESLTYGLAVGLQLRLSEVLPDGKAAMEFPEALPWLSTVKDWAALYPDKPEGFKQALVKFRHDWKQAVEQASQISETAARRLIAAHEQEVSSALRKRQAEERRDEALRRRFREKNYVEF